MDVLFRTRRRTRPSSPVVRFAKAARSAPPYLRPRNDPLTANEAKMAKVVRAAIRDLEEAFDWNVALRGLSAGDLAAVLAAFPFDDLPAALDPAGDFLRLEFEARADETAAAMRFRFDLVNPQALAYAQARSAALVTAVEESTRLAIRNLIEEAFRLGRDVRATARLLRDVVGLTPRLANAVTRFRIGLESSGRVSGATIDRLVARKADALLRYRTLTISRTEILAASNAGKVATFREAVARGLLAGTTPTKEWITAQDEGVCETCDPLDGETVGLEDVFSSGDDAPPVHPNCRCTVILTGSGEEVG